MDSKHQTRRRTRTTSRTAPAIGLPERLALYVFGVACLIAAFLDSPVPMAIAP